MSDPQPTETTTPPASHAQPVPPAHPETFPRGTTPTWEIEMLLSGAVVFALLQVPATLDQMFDSAVTKVGSGWAAAAFLVYCYAKAIVYSLILTFVVHLAARAYWIALVGINSVYPGGPKWAQARMGPIAREENAKFMPPIERLIAQADDRCSLIFASGILLVLLAMYSLALTAVVGLFSYFFARLLVPAEHRRWAMWVVGGVVTLPFVVVSLIDRHGRRKVANPKVERYVRGVQRLMLRTPIMRFANPLMLVIMSNRPKQRVWIVMTVALVAVLYFVVGEALVRRESMRIDSYLYLPDQPTQYAIDAEHYETRRRNTASLLPYIQAEVITEPYVRLFVPYSGTRHEPALLDACPDVRPFSKSFVRMARQTELDEGRARAILKCFADVLEIELDGTRIDALELHFASDATGGQRGLLAMIPVSDLPPGRHVLRVRRPPRPDEQVNNPVTESAPQSADQGTAAESRAAGGDEDRPLLRYEIAFWR